MKKNVRKFLSLLITLLIILSCVTVAFGAQEEKIPVVLIPGFGQSDTRVYDDNGSYLGDISEFSLKSFETNEILSSLVSPKKLSQLVNAHPNLAEYVYEFMCDLFVAFRHNDDGTPVNTTKVTRFNNPYSKLTAEERAEVDKHISLGSLSEYDDIRYYFTYDTFGSVKEAADDLHTYITDVVLAQTGAEKVNIVPVSQGGALFVEYLDLYKEDYKYINKVIGIVPAYDGATIVGDILTDQVKIYDIDYFHKTALPAVFKTLAGSETTGYLISMALRCVLSADVQQQVFKKALQAAVDCLAKNNSMMWALCPAEFYEQARERLISDESHDTFRSETDRYDLARKNFTSNLAELIDGGTVVHNIASYDVGCYLSVLFDHGNTNADDLLAPSSPGLGATCADTGKTLGKDYVSPLTYCSDPTHNHISPDNVLDASTGFLPENTWYFKGISHMGLNGREDVKNFAAQLILNDDIVDIYTYPGQSQFVELPEYEQVVDEEQGVIKYYNADGEFMYQKNIPQDSSNSFGDAFVKVLYNCFNFVSKLFTNIFPKWR
ncbi:MAG: hypothetical protein NC122_02495 [Faecalibacterium sp.]|nr:hypothetical protein [Ruminococcus sp.]MCM1392520.1 hypothetical protein [Ruminococcus sp.]MCM1485053.1 hypothetical protein [Faecalibacterium sp.]